MSSDSNSRLSPHAVWRMLEESSSLETATFADATALAASHERGASERVIGVAMNLDLAQMASGQNGSSRHPFFDEVLFGMSARARASDFYLLLLTTLSGTATGLDVPYLELCRERHVDGIVLVSFPPEEPGLIELVQSELPCVAIDTHVFGPRSAFVISDNVAGGSTAVHHLAALGRRRIAFIGVPGRSAPRSTGASGTKARSPITSSSPAPTSSSMLAGTTRRRTRRRNACSSYRLRPTGSSPPAT